MNDSTVTNVLTSQYKAALNMFRNTIEKVPTEYWNSMEYNNPIWQIAYHTIWATQLYLGVNVTTFEPWDKAIEGAESLGGSNVWENPEEGVIVEGYNTPDEIVSFIDSTQNHLKQAIDALPFNENSGFEWYPFTRLELHVMNIRHIQHHTAQIIERLKIKGIKGFSWAIDGNPPQNW